MREKITLAQLSTLQEIPGYRVIQTVGLVHGVSVRSKYTMDNEEFLQAARTVFEGNTTQYAKLCAKTREEATQDMLLNAVQKGGNGIVGIRYDSNAMLENHDLVEVFAYGTAVVLEPF